MDVQEDHVFFSESQVVVCLDKYHKQDMPEHIVLCRVSFLASISILLLDVNMNWYLNVQHAHVASYQCEERLE